MINNDIRFLIFTHCNIDDLKNCFMIDKLSYNISKDLYFWKVYHEKYHVPFYILNNNYMKSFNANHITKQKLLELGHHIVITWNILIKDLFNDSWHNQSLMNIIHNHVDFYEIRINDYRCILKAYEIDYEGCETILDLKMTLTKKELHCVVCKIIYYDTNYVIKKCY